MKKILTLMILCAAIFTQAQDLSQKLVNINFKNTKSKIVFIEITRQTGAVFTYGNFDDNTVISINCDNLPLKQVIPLLSKEIDAEVVLRNRYIIIKQGVGPENLILSGIINDSLNQTPLANASVYIKKNKTLANTNESGQFFIKIPADQKLVKLNIAKENYIDTVVVLVASKEQSIRINLKSNAKQTIAQFDSIGRPKIVLEKNSNLDDFNLEISQPNHSFNENFWDRWDQKRIDLKNIKEPLFNAVSLSLVPTISTNKLLSFHTKNNVSIGVVGSHSGGINGFETSGVYNFTHGNVKGAQIAGVNNMVSNDVNGLQVAGVFNAVKGKSDGAQIAGVFNINDSTVQGLQVSGVFNRVEDEVSGLQIAGVFNHNDTFTDGFQVGGIFNHVNSHMKGLQTAGLYNKSSYIEGLQTSGLFNLADSIKGAQITGLFNKAGNTNGVQISGFMNKADTLSGLQIGIFNHCNFNNGGLQLGLINFSKNGYQKFELSRNELSTYSLAYRSGRKGLHSLFFVGYNAENKNYQIVQTGFGLGSSIHLGGMVNFELDLQMRNTIDLKKAHEFQGYKFNLYNTGLFGLSFQFTKGFGIRGGATLNHLWYNKNEDTNLYVASLVKDPIYESYGDVYDHKLWLGWQVGLLFW